MMMLLSLSAWTVAIEVYQHQNLHTTTRPNALSPRDHSFQQQHDARSIPCEAPFSKLLVRHQQMLYILIGPAELSQAASGHDVPILPHPETPQEYS